MFLQHQSNLNSTSCQREKLAAAENRTTEPEKGCRGSPPIPVQGFVPINRGAHVKESAEHEEKPSFQEKTRFLLHDLLT